MKLELTNDRITVPADVLAPLLGLGVDDMRQRMRAGEITIRSETGEGEDAGRFRVTFRLDGRQIRLTCDADGNVIKTSRVRVGP